GAWDQPSAEAAGDRRVMVRLSFDANGTILSSKIVKPSGNAELDASVLAAVRSVPRVHGLSQRFLSSYASVSIEFKVE
ncbi:MAG: TonB family protein, partial [Candidatus Promineifilaceae bacterium]